MPPHTQIEVSEGFGVLKILDLGVSMWNKKSQVSRCQPLKISKVASINKEYSCKVTSLSRIHLPRLNLAPSFNIQFHISSHHQ